MPDELHSDRRAGMNTHSWIAVCVSAFIAGASMSATTLVPRINKIEERSSSNELNVIELRVKVTETFEQRFNNLEKNVDKRFDDLEKLVASVATALKEHNKGN